MKLSRWVFISRILLFSGMLPLASLSALGEVKLIVPAGYLPGIPFLTRVEVLNSTGRNWDLWNAEAILTVDQAGVTLSTNRVTIRNGLGSVLLTISGSGNFTLRATVNQEQAVRSIGDRSGEPVATVSGILVGAGTTWTGVVRVVGNVTVPTGHTLTIDSHTMVLVDGVSSGSSGIGITVNGAIRSLGTELFPVTITCANPAMNWGQIRHDGAQPSLYQYTFISKAGWATGEGHTGTGPALRSSNSAITLDHSVVSDLTAAGATIGKVMMATGSDLIIRETVFARARMGPEIATTGLLCTDSYFMEMSGPDDSDGIYLHDSGARSLTLTGCVFAEGTDDAIDTLDSTATIDNCIIRDWPNPNEDAKGVSAFNGEVILRRCLIVNCFAGVSSKSNGPLGILRIDHCTISGIDKGVSAATKSNATAGKINIYMTNSIVLAPDALHSDFGPEKFVAVEYCVLSEPWPGLGNIAGDPLFLNPSGGDFHLHAASPAIDGGDPAYPSDPNGSRTDAGFYTGQTKAGGFFVNISSPVTGAVLKGPTNVMIAASATSSTGTVAKVEFFGNGARLGEDVSEPYTYLWANVPIGNHILRAVAQQASGVMATSPPVNLTIISSAEPEVATLVPAGSIWRYLDDGSDQGTAWFQAGFDDSRWPADRAELGYGDGDETTVIQFGPSSNNKFRTTYFRHAFVFNEEPSRILNLNLRLLRDDGAVVYLNGREIFRASMPDGPVDYLTFATDAGEYSWETVALEPNLVAAGENIVAAEVHQGNANSSDLSFDLELGALLTAATNARPIVTITAPAEGTIIAAGSSFVLAANATDPDGAVTNVAFYANGSWLGNVATAPYEFRWNGIPAGQYVLYAAATDAFGLGGTSSNVNLIVSENGAPPAIATRFPLPGVVTNLTEITVTFTKAVIGVDAADLLVNGVPARRVSGTNETYSFTFPGLGAGTGVVQWSPLHGITDTFQPAAGFDHGNPEASWQYQLVDTAPPVVQTVDPFPDSSVSNLGSVTILFNEPVAGLNPSDLLMNSIPALSLTGSGAGPYTFTFARPQRDSVTMSWAADHGIRDESGNLFVPATWRYRANANEPGIVINEIMYHPASENPLEEYIELFNRSPAAVNLGGWKLIDGVEFTFPDVSVAPGEYLVVAADLATFHSKYSSVLNVVGNWTGGLSNSRDGIELVDARGVQVDLVEYADEGDWAQRQRGGPDRGHRGWGWFAAHDGLGKSAELTNPNLSNDTGQNWQSSRTAEGTPGVLNSTFTQDIAPFIENVAHYPRVPRSSDIVMISAEVSGGSGAGRHVELNYRMDTQVSVPFSAVPMRDDGLAGDAFPEDGIYSAVLPPMTNTTIVEFYVSASDLAGNARTWPAPAIASDDAAEPGGQVANALYQVDDTDYTGSQPLYKVVMTGIERAELQAIHDNINGAVNSDAQMNATFISVDGTGSALRYLAGVRNRGHGTRNARPSNFRVNFRSDHEWKGVLALNLNAQLSWLQVLGSALNLRAGVVGAYSRAVQLRVNSANPVLTGGTDRTYGSYAANEVIDADWADHHFPNDGEGNVYRAIRDIPPPEFDYRTIEVYPTLRGAEDKASYTNTWFKTSNVSEDDWTDLIGMLRVLGPNGTEPLTVENLRRVINVEQWLRHLAVMNLMGNSETGLNSGFNDDYFMYRGVNDPRFILMYYDLDQILGFGNSFAPGASLFSATTSQGSGRAMERLLRHPEIEPLYLETLRELIETAFAAEPFNALVDQILGEFVPDAIRNQLKNWMEARRTFVRSQLPPNSPPAAPKIQLSAAPRSPTPLTEATFQVSGEGITHYRYDLNGAGSGPEFSVSTLIGLSSLPEGTNTLSVTGKNGAGVSSTPETVVWVVNRAWPAVRLNEVLASRSGDQRDSLELFNEGPAAVNLSGMRLTDNLADPNRFVFGSVTLESGAYLVLESSQLGFSLDASGEGVYLHQSVSAGGMLLDSIVFGQQITDLSIGRLGQGGQWVLANPTMGTANIAAPVGNPGEVRINEWLAFGTSPFPEDFIELFNPNPLPVAIGSAYLTDRPIGNPRKQAIAPLSFIPAKGFALFTTGNGNSADEINFGLASEQGEIALFSSSGTLIDSVVYTPQRLGISNGRCPDGAATIRRLEGPTPNGNNDCPFVPPPPRSIVLIPFTNLWKYNASGADLGATWKDPGYDDSSWPSGAALIGFEDAALAEPLLTTFENPGFTTYYFRGVFNLDPAFTVSSIQVTHLIDDGAAFFVNGQEVARFGLAPGADYQTFATGNIGNASYQTFTVPSTAVLPGPNVFAVEVHQVTAGSSDMVFGLKLEALVATNTAAEPSVIINEVFVRNVSLPDVGGSRASWVELFNPGDGSADLAGMSLANNPADAGGWIFPVGTLLPSRSFTRVWFDSRSAASSSNTGIELSPNGGAIYIFKASPEGTQVQSMISYGIQAANWSIGRVPDGGINWGLTVPSPELANVAAPLGSPTSLRINEWMADPISGSDWFELHNPNPHPVDVSGFLLSDDMTDRAKHMLPPLSFLGSGEFGYQKFEADEELDLGANHVSFKLSASGEAIALSTAAGVLIDGVSFGSQTAGVSEGRFPDGSATIVPFPNSASPAASNFLASADRDGDGLPNDWETANNLNPNDRSDAMLDSDNDGFANLHEYLAGTSPRNSAQFLALRAERSAAGVILLFEGVPGRGYKVEYRDRLGSGEWRALATLPTPGVQSLLEVEDSQPGQGRFYRLLIVPSP